MAEVQMTIHVDGLYLIILVYMYTLSHPYELNCILHIIIITISKLSIRDLPPSILGAAPRCQRSATFHPRLSCAPTGIYKTWSYWSGLIIT